MRRILVDHARRKNAAKRGKREELSETHFAELAHPAPDDVILAVDEALTRFSEVDKEAIQLVELRFFVGLSMKEATEKLGISERSGERRYAYFTAWFRREFSKNIDL